MIREIIKSSSNRLTIDIPNEYVDKELEILVFSNSEVIKRAKNSEKEKLLKEFERVSKNRVKPKIDYYYKMEDETNNDIF